MAVENYSIPISVYRPGMISSSSITGHSNVTDWVSRLLYTFLVTKLVPKYPHAYADDSNGILELCPVDFVSQFIVSNMIDNSPESNTFNILNSSNLGLEWNELVNSIQMYNSDITIVRDYNHWFNQTVEYLKENVTESDRDRKTIWPMLDSFSRGITVIREEDKSQYHMHNMIQQMQKLKLTCPTVTSAIIVRALSYLNLQE